MERAWRDGMVNGAASKKRLWGVGVVMIPGGVNQGRGADGLGLRMMKVWKVGLTGWGGLDRNAPVSQILILVPPAAGLKPRYPLS